MKYYQKDAMLDILYPKRCPICGQFVRDVKCPDLKQSDLKQPGRNRAGLQSKIIPASFSRVPSVYELICKPCFFVLPFVLEPYCMICGRPLENPLLECCEDCRRYRHEFSEARAVFSYKGVVQKSLYQLKYGGRKEYARFFAASMGQYLSAWIRRRGITAIVPIPLHPSRLRKRTYNQAEEIAVRLGEHLDIPVYSDLLIRKKETIAQKNLNRQERMKNLSGAFCVNSKWLDQKSPVKNRKVLKSGKPDELLSHLQGEHILLVDDIFTTGSTVDAAAAELLKTGFHSVFVAVVAVTG